MSYLSTGFAQALLYDQTSGVTTSGLVSQDFGPVYQTYDSRIADDFVVPAGETWYLDSIKAYGFYSTGAAVTEEAGVTFQIYQDNSGMPGTLVYADTIEANMDPDNNGSLNAPIPTPLQLSAGTYWVAFAARKDYVVNGNVEGLWYWRLDSSQTGNEALWENLGGGFAAGCTNWTPLTDPSCVAVDYGDVVFRVYGCLGANKPTIVTPLEDSAFCEGPSITLTANASGSNLAYLWNVGPTVQSITTDTSGYYAVTIYDTATLCGVKDDAYINIKPVPKYELEDDTVCPEILPYTLFANPAGATVTWFDNSTGIVTTVNQAGTYWASYEGTNGCTGGDTMTLTVTELDPPTFFPGSQIDLCDGDDVVVSTAQAFISYAWGNANDTNSVLSTADSFIVSTGGSFWLEAQASNGCFTDGEFTVIDRPLPEPNITVKYTSTLNIRLGTSQDYNNYTWSNGDTSKTLLVTENGSYSVTVVDEYGCEGMASIDIDNVGVDNPIAAAFNFYPNPTNGLINFSWPSELIDARIHLMDASGRHISTIDQANGVNSIDLSGLARGIYFLKIRTASDEGNLRVVKL